MDNSVSNTWAGPGGGDITYRFRCNSCMHLLVVVAMQLQELWHHSKLNFRTCSLVIDFN